MNTLEGDALAKAKRSLSGAAVELGPVPFGDYFLLKKLGEGGMGEVFLAKAGAVADIEKLLVVKTLREQHTEDPEYVRRFIDEARIVVQLSHRNICPVFDVGKVSGQYYLAMEHIHGRDLKTLADRARSMGTPLPAEVAIFLVGEVLEALDYAHRLSDPATGNALELVHRDVSPHNVMVNFEGEAKLIDFGLAASRLKVERTRPDVVMGKMAYMPPEQARGEPVDGRIDQFAAAVMLYELLTGKRYYEGMTFQDVFAIVGGNTPDGKPYRPPGFSALDPGMQAVLDGALGRDPEERYPGCAEFKDALDSWLLDHRLRAGTRHVRKAMLTCFENELAAERELFAAAQKVRTQSNPVATGPKKVVDSQHTVRIAHDPGMFDSGSAPSATGGVFASSEELDADTEPVKAGASSSGAHYEQTEHVSRAPSGPVVPRSETTGSWRRLLILAAGVLAIAATAAVAIGLWAGSALQGKARLTTAASDGAPDPTPEPEAAVEPETVANHPGHEGGSLDEPDPPGDGDHVDDVVDEPNGKSKRGRKGQRRRRTKDVARHDPPPRPSGEVPVVGEVTTQAPTTLEGELRMLLKRSASCSCAAKLREDLPYFHQQQVLQQREFVANVRACAAKCATSKKRAP